MRTEIRCLMYEGIPCVLLPEWHDLNLDQREVARTHTLTISHPKATEDAFHDHLQRFEVVFGKPPEVVLLTGYWYNAMLQWHRGRSHVQPVQEGSLDISRWLKKPKLYRHECGCETEGPFTACEHSNTSGVLTSEVRGLTKRQERERIKKVFRTRQAQARDDPDLEGGVAMEHVDLLPSQQAIKEAWENSDQFREIQAQAHLNTTGCKNCDDNDGDPKWRCLLHRRGAMFAERSAYKLGRRDGLRRGMDEMDFPDPNDTIEARVARASRRWNKFYGAREPRKTTGC